MDETVTCIVKAPVRISFSGGGTDFPEYFMKYGGCVLSTTIDKYITVKLHKKEDSEDIKIHLESFKSTKVIKSTTLRRVVNDLYTPIISTLRMFHEIPGLELDISSDIKPGNGLGTSSALIVSLIGGLSACSKARITKEQLAQKAIYLEREILGRTGGFQDQYASSFGGFNLMEFYKKDTVSVTSVRISHETLKNLEDNLLLFQLKGNRNSSIKQATLVRNILQNKKVIQALHLLKRNTYKMQDALRDNNLNDFAKILHLNWELKKDTSSVISNNQIDSIYKKALQNGAIGGKLLGAGGGGCLLLYCPVNDQNSLKKSLQTFDGRFIDFKFESKGFHIL